MLSRLWRRSRLMTDISLIEIRYEGPSAQALQVFRACYFGVVWNMITIGWVTAAMLSIFSAAVGTPLTGEHAGLTLLGQMWTGLSVHFGAVTVLMVLAAAYSLFSGLWGVVISDLIQFGIAMAGAVILAVYAVGAAGGMSTLTANPAVSGHLKIVPDLHRYWELPTATFFMYVGLMWFTDKTADSGGYIAQRLLAARDEQQGMLSMLWFVVAHYALRPWPWIVAAMASLVLLPNVGHRDAYPQAGHDRPAGRAARAAGGQPVGGVHLHRQHAAQLGRSYLTRSVYIRLWRPAAGQRELVWVGRIITAGLMVLGAVVSYYIGSIEKAWKFLALLGHRQRAGAGGALAVVADQRLERDRRPGRGLHRRDLPAGGPTVDRGKPRLDSGACLAAGPAGVGRARRLDARLPHREGRQAGAVLPAAVRAGAAGRGGRQHGRLGAGDVPDGAYLTREAPRVLPPHPPAGAAVARHCPRMRHDPADGRPAQRGDDMALGWPSSSWRCSASARWCSARRGVA